jgi:hypothetical protein
VPSRDILRTQPKAQGVSGEGHEYFRRIGSSGLQIEEFGKGGQLFESRQLTDPCAKLSIHPQ